MEEEDNEAVPSCQKSVFGEMKEETSTELTKKSVFVLFLCYPHVCTRRPAFFGTLHTVCAFVPYLATHSFIQLSTNHMRIHM